VLTEQGWTGEQPVTVISDGEAALPELVRRAIGGEIRHILDWRQISMRVRHAEQALAGVRAFEPPHRGGLDILDYEIGRLRHLIWNGYHHEARRELFDARHLAHEAVYLNGERLRPAVSRFLARCEECAATSQTTRRHWSITAAAPIRVGRSRHHGPKAASTRSRTRGWQSDRACAGRRAEPTASRSSAPLSLTGASTLMSTDWPPNSPGFSHSP